MNRDKLIKNLVKLQMDNPCLSEDIDYEPDSVRLKYYNEQANTLNDEQLKEEFNELTEALSKNPA